jgi:ATP-dependent Clp protease protease subunit
MFYQPSPLSPSSHLVPTVVESSIRGDRAYDLFSRLLRERIVLINGPIDDQMASLVVAELLFLASESDEREINIHINSGGGVVTAGMAMYDTIRSLRAPVTTTCVGMAASFGTILLMSGDPGRRYALLHARIHMHQPLIVGNGISGQVTDIDIHAREFLRTRETVNEIIALHTGKPIEVIQRDTERDFFMSASEAQEYGIIDHVLPLQNWKERNRQ